MPNILISPVSGILEFNNDAVGASTLDSSLSGVRLTHNSGELNVKSFAATPDRFTVDGSFGRLFSVSDSVTGNVFSVNDAAGLPIISVDTDTDDVVTIGTFNTNALVVKNDKVGIGTSTPAAALHVISSLRVDNGATSGALNLGADVQSTLRTSNTRKLAAIVAPDFSNTRSIEFLSSDSTSASVNSIHIGGRSGGSNFAATSIFLATAANTSTAGGINALTINSSQNVGIGTSTPDQRLTVSGNINVLAGGGYRINNTAAVGQYLRGNGTQFVSSAILIADVPTLNQNTTGNAATATNVAYSGLTGTVPTWNQNTTGNAATATNVAYSGLTGTVPTWNQNTTGSAATLTTARTIGDVSFNGSANINLAGVNTTGNQDTTGNAATVTNGVTTVGNQTISGLKTFDNNIKFANEEEGIILKSPNGTQYKVTVNDDGSLQTTLQPDDGFVFVFTPANEQLFDQDDNAVQVPDDYSNS